MKVKRLKTVRRNLAFYRHHFGLRDPLQVLVDGNFCHVALQYKIHIKEQLPKALSAVCKEQVTRCVTEELRRLGPDYSGALFIAKRFEMRRCSHKEPVTASECLASLVGDNNPNNLLVATQDMGLRARLRKAGSVPLLYLQYNMLLLEPPSRTSILRAKQEGRREDHRASLLAQVEHQKLLPAPIEVKAAKRKADPDSVDDVPPVAVHHRKRAKGPNPLSIRKPKRSTPERPAPARTDQPEPELPSAAAAAPAAAPNAEPAATPKPARRRRRGTRAGVHHRPAASSAGPDGVR